MSRYRNCWTCRHDDVMTRNGRDFHTCAKPAMLDQGEPDIVDAWIARHIFDGARHFGLPRKNAPACPGWAPKESP